MCTPCLRVAVVATWESGKAAMSCHARRAVASVNLQASGTTYLNTCINCVLKSAPACVLHHDQATFVQSTFSERVSTIQAQPQRCNPPMACLDMSLLENMSHSCASTMRCLHSRSPILRQVYSRPHKHSLPASGPLHASIPQPDTRHFSVSSYHGRRRAGCRAPRQRWTWLWHRRQRQLRQRRPPL